MNDLWSVSTPCEQFERIGVVAFFPRHFKGEEFDPTVLLKRAQLKENSLSASRLSWISPDEIFNHVVRPALLKPKPDNPIGILVAVLPDIEAIRTEESKQAFQVTVDGTRENPAHVTIGYVPNNGVKSDLSLRAQLIEVFSSFEPIECMPQIFTACSWIRSRTATHPSEPNHRNN
jgi:hypothetical protein